MKKLFVILFVAVVALSLSAFAADTMLGPHNVAEKGCKSCHAPHNGSVANGGTDAATGDIYLWGRTLKAATYSTFGGTSSFTTVTNPLETDPVVHTQMCLSCHDGGITDASMSDAAKVASDTDSLKNDHPVHAVYAAPTAAAPYNWNITIAGGRASFVDTTFSAGHPARLFVDAAGTTAYVECGSCHNPHSWTKAVYKIAGTYQTKTSSKFVRGWYDPADGSSQANFCRSCHYSKTDVFDGSVK